MQTLEQVKTQIADEAATKQRAADAQFRKMGKQIAEGKEFPLSIIQPVIDAAGKTIDDLFAAAQRHRERVRLYGIVQTHATMAKELPGIYANLADAQAELEKARSKYDDIGGPLVARLGEIEQAEAKATEARQRLLDLNDDPEKREHLEMVCQRKAEIGARLNQLVKTAAARHQGEHVRDGSWGDEHLPREKARRMARGQAMIAAADAADAELEAVRKELADAQADEKKAFDLLAEL
jgi:hypothetical protein